MDCSFGKGRIILKAESEPRGAKLSLVQSAFFDPGAGRTGRYQDDYR